MEIGTYKIIDSKIIINLRDRVCDTEEKLIQSELFRRILTRCIVKLSTRNSPLIKVFDRAPVVEQDIQLLIETLTFLTKIPADLVPKVAPGSEQFFRDRTLFNDFIEYLYNYWRSMQRLIICDSEGDLFDQRPYSTFNSTVETLTHLVRSTYRDIQESITGMHPRIYRQVHAGAEIAAIALPKDIWLPDGAYQKLKVIPVIRQVLIYPPLIFEPPMNKRSGVFERVSQNPLNSIPINKEDWLCYPARVGPLLILVYFSLPFFELGFALSNLFELADDETLKQKPDAVYLFGVKPEEFPLLGKSQTVFFDDTERNILAAAVPGADKFGYFGYLKKMVLTLHNIRMMKIGRMPFHGALVNISIRNRGSFTILVMGDTGAGKSETLEALRTFGEEDVENITIIADDMGSLEIDENGVIIGYGTETGAFVRLDDLQPGYAFGQIDRTIIMSPTEVNARVVLPVTTYFNVVKGFAVDIVLYANNYEKIDDKHRLIERFTDADQALQVFADGAVMSKGTTTTSGLVKTYFANVFGPEQYQKEHDEISKRYFRQFFTRGIFVGQIRTQLGIRGKEREGPSQAAKELLEILRTRELRSGPHRETEASDTSAYHSLI